MKSITELLLITNIKSFIFALNVESTFLYEKVSHCRCELLAATFG